MTDISTYTTIEQCQARLDEIKPLIIELAQGGADVPGHEDHSTFKSYLNEQQGLRYRINQIQQGNDS